MNRLETRAPELASKLRSADQQRQRSAAVAAASWAVGVAGIDQADAATAVRLLSEGAHGQVDRNSLARLVEELDEVAWSVQDAVETGSGSDADYLVAFGQARAVASVLFAAEPDAELAALEAIYEASVVTSDSSTLFVAVEAALAR